MRTTVGQLPTAGTGKSVCIKNRKVLNQAVGGFLPFIEMEIQSLWIPRLGVVLCDLTLAAQKLIIAAFLTYHIRDPDSYVLVDSG